MTPIDQLVAGVRCPLCGGMRRDTLIVLVDAPLARGCTAVRVQCVRCSLFWSYVVTAGPGTSTVSGDAAAGPPAGISADELTEVHAILRDLEGPLSQVFDPCP